MINLTKSQMKKIMGGDESLEESSCSYAQNVCATHNSTWSSYTIKYTLESAQSSVTGDQPYYCCDSCYSSCLEAH
jgi:hypothetical protein